MKGMALCSWDLTIWVTPHQDANTEGPEGAGKQSMWGAIICFTPLLPFFPSRPLCSGGGGGGGVSSFFHPVLPGAVQFLDPPISGSSRLLLSISCSSLLPPCRSWSSLLWPETSKPATLQHAHSTTESHIWVRPRFELQASKSGKRGQQDAELCRYSGADSVVEALG